MFNTIILKTGQETLAKSEYKNFHKGDTIFGINSEPEEVRRWNIKYEEDAKEELSRHSCEYIEYAECYGIKEWALEYCECDEDGDFSEGSDFELAKEE